MINYNLALHGNYCVSNWFSLPFAYKRKWEREVSPPVGEVARSARGVDRQNASPLRVEGSALVAVRRNTPHEVRHSARWRAVTPCGSTAKRQKALKGCGGKQEFSPTSNTLSLLSQASETVRRTVSEEHYTFKL